MTQDADVLRTITNSNSALNTKRHDTSKYKSNALMQLTRGMLTFAIPIIVTSVNIVVTHIAMRAGTAFGVIQNEAHATMTMRELGRYIWKMKQSERRLKLKTVDALENLSIIKRLKISDGLDVSFYCGISENDESFHDIGTTLSKDPTEAKNTTFFWIVFTFKILPLKNSRVTWSTSPSKNAY